MTHEEVEQGAIKTLLEICGDKTVGLRIEAARYLLEFCLEIRRIEFCEKEQNEKSN